MAEDKENRYSTDLRKSLPTGGFASSYRYTPYETKTPKVRELGFTKTRESQFFNSGLEDFVHISWTSFKLTALYNFSYARPQLLKYSQYLQACIGQALKKNMGVLIDRDNDFRVSISIVNNIARSQDDNKALKIQVLAKEKNGKQKEVLVAMLVSAERIVDKWEHKKGTSDIFKVLPLMFVKGTQVYLNGLVKFLESAFSCHVQPLKFSNVQMMWMVAMWAGSKSEGNLKPLHLVYSTGLKNLSTIEYTIAGNSAYDIWKKVHDSKSNEMTDEEIYSFMEVLEDYFFSVLSINIRSFQLSTVGTNAAVVTRNGLVKILSVDAIPFVLRYLTSLAQETDLAS